MTLLFGHLHRACWLAEHRRLQRTALWTEEFVVVVVVVIAAVDVIFVLFLLFRLPLLFLTNMGICLIECEKRSVLSIAPLALDGWVVQLLVVLVPVLIFLQWSRERIVIPEGTHAFNAYAPPPPPPPPTLSSQRVTEA